MCVFGWICNLNLHRDIHHRARAVPLMGDIASNPEAATVHSIVSLASNVTVK
jgi:hypothetical protein